MAFERGMTPGCGDGDGIYLDRESPSHYCSTIVAIREGFGGGILHRKSHVVGGGARVVAGETPGLRWLNARMIQVRHRSYATYSRQPRQVRKEATVTGSCVCSGVPVPGLFFSLRRQTNR